MQDQIEKLSGKKETVRNNQAKMLEINNIIRNMRISRNRLISRLDIDEEENQKT